MSKSKMNRFTGGNNSNAKSVIDNNGNIFVTLKECAVFNNIHVDTVRRRICKGVYKLIEKDLTNRLQCVIVAVLSECSSE